MRLIFKPVFGITKLLIQFFLISFVAIFSPIKKIIFINIQSERIGHLAFNTDLFLRNLQLEKKKCRNQKFYIGLSQNKLSNKQLFRMFSRKFLILKLPRFFHSLIFKSIQNNNYLFRNISTSSYSHYDAFNNTNINLIFNSDEFYRGQKLLNKMSIKKGDWFVCFHTRDSQYLKKNGRELYGNKINWNYHNYRDSSIITFLKAAEFVVSKGGYAIRMGRDVAEPLPKGLNPMIVDYATNHWSDFGDIFLSSQCSFFIGSNAGLSVIPYIFHRPMIMTNYTPYFESFSPRLDNLGVPSKVWSIDEKRYLSFGEIFNSDINHYHSDRQFKEAGLKVIASSAEEILDVTTEMHLKISGKINYSEDDQKLRSKFSSLYPQTHPCHNTPIANMISIDFLRKNKELIC